MTISDIKKAYIRMREIDSTIPDDVLDFMKDCAIEKLDGCKGCKEKEERIKSILGNIKKASGSSDIVDTYGNYCKSGTSAYYREWDRIKGI